MSYTWTTTSGSSINGLSGMTISSAGNVIPSYSINLGGTSLETDDIKFIHSLQKAGVNGDVSAALMQLIEDYKYTWNTSTFTGNTTQKNIQEKESESMDIIKNFHFGPCGDRAKISPIGIAIKNSNGEWVSYDKEKNEIVNVDLLNFGNGNYVYMIPVSIKDIHIGDAIIHNGHIMFVKAIRSDYIQAVDVTAGELKRILPTKNMFGFNFVTKIVSLIDMSKISASEDNPFGNLLPLVLMNKDSSILPFLLFNEKEDIDPMLFSLVAMDHSDKNDMLPFILMQYFKK